jgi:type IV conjugative transfer system coupling protein TraD
MAKTETNTIKNFTTGGDIIFHKIQLLLANALRLIAIGFGILSLLGWAFIEIFCTKYERYVFFKNLYAQFWKLVHMPAYHISFIKPDGEVLRSIRSNDLSDLIYITPELSNDSDHVFWYIILALVVAILATSMLAWYWTKYGEDEQKDEFLRGQKLIPVAELIAMIKKPLAGKLLKDGKASCLNLAKVPVPFNLICRNFLFLGSMGVGKSQGIMPLFEDVRKWKKTVVCYDKTGDFMSKYFRPEKDYILNIVDERCQDWDVFADLIDETDISMVARFFVPEKKEGGDEFFDNNARILLEDLIAITRETGGTMSDIYHIITQYTLPKLFELLKEYNSPSCAILNPENVKTSEGIRSTLASQPSFRFFKYFEKKNAAFSIREFVRREDNACLFLTSSSTKHQICKPFINAWIQLALTEAMSMDRNPVEPRLFFFLDELASLSKLNDLDIALTEARKFGIVSVIGIQNLAQMDEIYGEDSTKTYVSNLQNKAVFRIEEYSSAERAADSLGKEDTKEHNEGTSFGVESSRDGVNLSKKRDEIHLVTPTEIMTLPDLVCFVKIAGDFKIAKAEIEYVPRETIAPDYVKRQGLELKKPSGMVQQPVIQSSPEPLLDDEESKVEGQIDHTYDNELNDF